LFKLGLPPVSVPNIPNGIPQYSGNAVILTIYNPHSAGFSVETNISASVTGLIIVGSVISFSDLGNSVLLALLAKSVHSLVTSLAAGSTVAIQWY